MPEGLVINNSLENTLDRIRNKVFRTLDGTDVEGNGQRGDFIVEHTFSDCVVVREMHSGKYYEVPYIKGDSSQVYLGQPKEVEKMYVQKRFEDAGVPWAKKGLELTGPIVMKNSAKRIAYAAVLVPGEQDSDGEEVTKEKIEASAHEWMANYRNVDYMHGLNNVGVPVESYILPAPMTVKMNLGNGEEDVDLPEGTWVLASKFGETTWEQITTGFLNGYSVMGVRRTALDTSIKNKEAVDNAACKRTLLQDLGPDWVPTHVSVVDEPAVPKAKFFALKSKAEVVAEEVKEETSWAGKAGRRFSEATLGKLKEAFESLKNLISEAEEERTTKSKEVQEDMNEEQIKNLFEEAIKSAIAPIQEEIQALKSQKVEEPEVKKEDETPEVNQELEAFKSQVMKKLDAISKKSAAPRAIKGQDGEVVKEEKTEDLGRDAYGRKRGGK